VYHGPMRAIVLALALLAGCTTENVYYLGIDAGTGDSGTAPIDAGQDAGVDSGPACECSSGACCDGCHLRPTGYICAPHVLTQSGCSGKSSCQNKGLVLELYYADRTCTGFSPNCDGYYANDTVDFIDCDVTQGYPYAARCEMPTDGGLPYCTHGPTCTTESP
jgi:hypothetical protein